MTSPASSLLPLYYGGLQDGDWINILLLLFCGFLLWMWFGTRYTVDNTFVRYRSGPFYGKVRTRNINEINRDTTMWSGFRPALAVRGLVLKYNRYDEIYISPDSNDAFIEYLLSVNPEIRITGS